MDIDVKAEEGKREANYGLEFRSVNFRCLYITGGSRGIGLAIAVRAARDGANVVVAAKTGEPHAKLPGTIYSAAEEIAKAGGKALPILCDLRDEDQLAAAVDKTVATFGGIDILDRKNTRLNSSHSCTTHM